MTAFERVSTEPYKIQCTLKDVNDICNKEKTVPAEWISENKADVTKDFIDYARPLIEGNIHVPEENGLPKFVYRKEFTK